MKRNILPLRSLLLFPDKLHWGKCKFHKKFVRNCSWTNDFVARYNCIVEIPRQTQTKQGENRTEGGGGMFTYEQQTKKLLSKRQAVLDRIESDKAEIEKINAKLNAIQLAKIRDALGCDEQGLFELITKHPEQLAKLKQESTAKSDTAQDSDESELIGQTSFFDEKSFKD